MSGSPDGASGRTKETYFCPNSVVGRISTLTLAGISSAAVGLERDVDLGLLAVLGDLTDLADERAVDPDVAELGQLESGAVGLDRHHR